MSRLPRLPVVLPAFVLLAACSSPSEPGASQPANQDADGNGGNVVVYSGRNEELVGPILDRFSEESGIEVETRYGDTAEMANLIITEGENTPADVFIAQDAGALGAVAQEGLFASLPTELLDSVDERFRSPAGEWVGLSGRARVVVYNTDALSESDLPDSIFDFTDPEWSGRIGWAPTNGSFQAFVTALRLLEGEGRAREWLEGIQANDPKVYEGNNPALDAVIAGEVDIAFINHYYLMQRLDEDPDVPAANYFLTDGDPGALVNVAGAGVLTTSGRSDEAIALLEFLVSDEAQQYFAEETKEYPLIEGVEPAAELPPLSQIGTRELDLSDLSDLEGTLNLLQEAGVL